MKTSISFEEAGELDGWSHLWLSKDGKLWLVQRHENAINDFGFSMDDMVVHEGYTAVQYYPTGGDYAGAIAITTFKVDRKLVEDLLSYLVANQKGNSTIAIKQVRGFAYTEFYVDEFKEKFKIPRSNWGMLMGRRNPKNIARKADLGIQDPFVQARMTYPGFHSEYDEPEDFPQYPMAGDLQKRMTSPSEWKRLQASRVRMYGRKAMNPRTRKPVDEWASFESDYEQPEAEQCPACGGEAQFMGTLGKTDWFRCRQCGMDSRRQSNPASVAQDVVAVYSTKGGAYQLVVVVEFDGCYGIQYIDHQKHTGGSAGLCDQRALNDKLTELIYWADRIDGIKYDLVYQRPASRPMYGMNPR